MREGIRPNVVCFKDGICNGMLLGYDSVAEHEGGVDYIKNQFCSSFVSFENRVEAYKATKHLPTIEELISMLDINLEQIIHREYTDPVIDGEESSFLFKTISSYKLKDMDEYLDQDFARLRTNQAHREWPQRDSKAHSNYQSAWSNSGFSMFGQGKKEYKRLKDFYEAIQRGTVAIGSGHLPMFSVIPHVGGLCLVDTARMTYADKQVLNSKAVETQESIVLYAEAKVDEIRQLINHVARNGTSFVWPKRMLDKSIVYCINPGYQVKADYLGPYTEAQIRRWVRLKCCYQLTTSSPDYANA